MAIEKLDHYSVRTALVERSVDFYRNTLGLQKGPRPPFNFPGAWLYRLAENGEVVGTSVVHIVGINTDASAGLSDYLGDKPLAQETGSGALDHIAFSATNISDMYARLASHRVQYRERKVPAMGIHQIFVEDPDGVTIELNYPQPADIAAGERNMASMASRG
jgi:catechol 2,3-dioxygenase-like lactoylglutathione lyase family enzyme